MLIVSEGTSSGNFTLPVASTVLLPASTWRVLEGLEKGWASQSIQCDRGPVMGSHADPLCARGVDDSASIQNVICTPDENILSVFASGAVPSAFIEGRLS